MSLGKIPLDHNRRGEYNRGKKKEKTLGRKKEDPARRKEIWRKGGKERPP